MVSHEKKRNQTEDAQKQNIEANSWTVPVGSNWRKTVNCTLKIFIVGVAHRILIG
jgi:hypothetical protein